MPALPTLSGYDVILVNATRPALYRAGIFSSLRSGTRLPRDATAGYALWGLVLWLADDDPARTLALLVNLRTGHTFNQARHDRATVGELRRQVNKTTRTTYDRTTG